MLLGAGGRPERSRSGRRWMVTCLLACVVLMIMSIRTPWLHPIERALYQWIYQPVRDVVYFPLRLIDSSLRDWRESDDLQLQISLLDEENRVLRAQTQILGHLQAENRRLRMLMDSVLDVRVPVSVAELRDSSIDGYREIVTISRGSNDGVYPNQAVIDPYGLVGQVVDVFPDEARVMLISDARSRVPVYVARTQQRAVVAGSADAGVLTLPEMPVDSDIHEGDELISSGLGGVYPRGYPVAKVVKVARDPRLSFMKVSLTPSAKLSSMLEVLLLDNPGQTTPAPMLSRSPPLPVTDVEVPVDSTQENTSE